LRTFPGPSTTSRKQMARRALATPQPKRHPRRLAV
jgi:hypothetical protein